MTQSQVDKRISILQYLNTFILSVLAIISWSIFTTIKDIKIDQEAMKTRIERITIFQDHNTQQVDNVDERVKQLEVFNIKHYPNEYFR